MNLRNERPQDLLKAGYGTDEEIKALLKKYKEGKRMPHFNRSHVNEGLAFSL